MPANFSPGTIRRILRHRVPEFRVNRNPVDCVRALIKALGITAASAAIGAFVLYYIYDESPVDFSDQTLLVFILLGPMLALVVGFSEQREDRFNFHYTETIPNLYLALREVFAPFGTPRPKELEVAVLLLSNLWNGGSKHQLDRFVRSCLERGYSRAQVGGALHILRQRDLITNNGQTLTATQRKPWSAAANPGWLSRKDYKKGPGPSKGPPASPDRRSAPPPKKTSSPAGRQGRATSRSRRKKR